LFTQTFLISGDKQHTVYTSRGRWLELYTFYITTVLILWSRVDGFLKHNILYSIIIIVYYPIPYCKVLCKLPKVTAGPKKTPFLCSQGRVVHARGRVVLS